MAAGFVPEGLNDRSQAIYCLGFVKNGIRPIGYGVKGYCSEMHHFCERIV